MLPTKAQRFVQVKNQPATRRAKALAREYREEQREIGPPYPPCMKCQDIVISACFEDGFECRTIVMFYDDPLGAQRCYKRKGEDY